jgi:hypothetical protein
VSSQGRVVTHRSAWALARGQRGGIVITLMPAPATTHVEHDGELAATVAGKEPVRALTEAGHEGAGRLRGPRPVEVGGGGEHGNVASADFEHEEHMHAGEGDRVGPGGPAVLAAGGGVVHVGEAGCTGGADDGWQDDGPGPAVGFCVRRWVIVRGTLAPPRVVGCGRRPSAAVTVGATALSCAVPAAGSAPSAQDLWAVRGSHGMRGHVPSLDARTPTISTPKRGTQASRTSWGTSVA